MCTPFQCNLSTLCNCMSAHLMIVIINKSRSLCAYQSLDVKNFNNQFQKSLRLIL